MNLLKNGITISRRAFLTNAVFFMIFLTLFFIFSYHIIRHVALSVDNRLMVQALFNFVIATSLLASSFFVHKINSGRLICTSSIAIVTMSSLVFIVPTPTLKLIIIFVIGIFFSMGFLSFFRRFWKSTVPEERGRVGGLIGLAALPFEFVVDNIVAPSLSFPETIMLSIALSSGILLVMLLIPPKAVLTEKKWERVNYTEKRTIFLYSIPWILFSLINVTLAQNSSTNISQQVFPSFYLLLISLQLIGVVFGVVIGGFVADFFGRRLSLALSLTLYGISAVIVGLFTSNELLSFSYIINGLGWGVLFTLYIFVVWGDLANEYNCAKMYSIGLIIYYLTAGFGLLTEISMPIVVSSLASCLLVFLSNIPIALAPELLPSDIREKIRLTLHMNAVKKIKKQSPNQG